MMLDKVTETKQQHSHRILILKFANGLSVVFLNYFQF